MGGYYTDASYVGFMPDGSKRWFVSDEEYKEAYLEALEEQEYLFGKRAYNTRSFLFYSIPVSVICQ